MSEKFTKMKFQNLKYADISKEERQSDLATCEFLLHEEEILMQIEGFHSRNKKCAAVCILNKNQYPDGFVAGYDTILDFFNFKQVKQALDNYVPEDSICYLFIRNNKITASILGLKNTGQKKVLH